MKTQLNNQTYLATSVNGQYEFEVEIIGSQISTGFPIVRCLDDDETLILNNHDLWTLDRI